MLKIRSILELLIAAALGGGGAVSVDFILSMDGSLLHGFSALIDSATAYFMKPPLPLHFAAAALIAFSAVSIFYFRPLSRKGAFASGFAAIAILAIFIP
jgi:hypothetical protein